MSQPEDISSIEIRRAPIAASAAYGADEFTDAERALAQAEEL